MKKDGIFWNIKNSKLIWGNSEATAKKFPDMECFIYKRKEIKQYNILNKKEEKNSMKTL
jgi:hypothetical protein